MNILLIVASYLIGTLPFAYMAGRFYKGIDVREIGDRNAGASNISRHVGSTAGMIVLGSDISKGVLVILLAQAFATQSTALWCGLAAVAGHNWPVFLKFRGGRGMAITIGIMLALVTIPMAIVSIAGLLSLLKKRSLIFTGIIMWVMLPLLEWLFRVPGMLIAYSLALPCLSGIVHLVTTRHLSSDQKKEALCW
jgi:acyl phosphate:glycerol-3-phosphate acyltransferase